MQTNTTHPGIAAAASPTAREVDYAYQGYNILHWGFVAAPLIAGLDKFFHWLTDWDLYLWPFFTTFGKSGRLEWSCFQSRKA